MVSKRLIAAYVIDWLTILVIGLATYGLSKTEPRHHVFSLVDLTISYPYIPDSISTLTLVLVALIAPAVIIFLVALIAVPGPRASRGLSRSQVLKLKLWEFEKGWAGLALSVVAAAFITQGSKNAIGKPRPDFLSRCQPDLNNIAAHVATGFAKDLSKDWQMVHSSICLQPDKSVLKDGFKSFPSGHASWSWSGLSYLFLYLCSKFAISIPHLTSENSNLRDEVQNGEDVHASDHPLRIRNTNAAPPVYFLIPAFVPIGTAFYICSTRWAEYYHHGYDLIVGSLIGIFTGWFAFRWYHLPLGRGQGWAWGARSSNRAFGIGVGTGGYVGPEGWGNVVPNSLPKDANRDIEMGRMGPSSSTEESNKTAPLPMTGGYQQGQQFV
ncbi:acid phosphatase/Vanadium-dependent haloperoxidase [Piedraia hortae CBS 480.64]|uniref:Acid phosphatase/Vanadium-dependent haloperoxidase n=1 Tax=Piedraia hortae CBS 480.64 TaxID=1314780 RepID=A0A6A7C6F8_9PEZI|nr:acid phosphatase/Vanadium-dependent haloperoxidase [Piedraia hortae CBS 480.64]